MDNYPNYSNYPSYPAATSYQQQLDQERWKAAVGRTYTTPAVITLVLYVIFWLPGLIANIVYLQSAGNVQRLTGQVPEGKGCLTALIWVFFWIPLLTIVIVGAVVLLSRH